MKVLKLLKRILLGILVVCFYCFAVIITILMFNRTDYGVTQFDDVSLINIDSSITSENFSKGDLVITRKNPIAKIEVGDEAFVYYTNEDDGVEIALGTIGEISTSTNSIVFKNGSTYEMEFVIGEPEKVYNHLGTLLSIVESTWGFLFAILIPCFLIFIFSVYSLIVEIKFGKEDTNKKEEVKEPEEIKIAEVEPEALPAEEKPVAEETIEPKIEENSKTEEETTEDK